MSNRMARRTDPSTSKAAGKSLSESVLSALKIEVLQFLAERGSATDEEIEETIRERHNWQMSYSTARKRRTDLFHDGYVDTLKDDNGKPVKKAGASGRNHLVWMLTDKGRAAVASIEVAA